ncbi:hypothetical protein [Streptomyces sp. NPDC097619]|uniref:hypothetical protein n=1 Tax=Streptomyces sp. NPDC097619 TaxID=3157228 RepID=UPI00332A3D09
MAALRTSRAAARALTVPVTAALALVLVAFGAGTAQADDNAAAAADKSNATVAGVLGSGVLGDNVGSSSTAQQVATGWGASNQNNNAQSTGNGFTVIGQSNAKDAVVFHPLP